jgi:orotate phosphoribosyltransferase-like protein
MNNELSKSERQAIVMELHQNGMTERAIAKKIGVSRSTVFNDINAAKKRAKQDDPTLHILIDKMWDADGDMMPTGAAISERALNDLGMSISVDTAERARIVVKTRREESAREKDVVIDWTTLPGTMKDKLEKMRRQVRRELEAEFESHVVAEVQHRLDGAIKAIERRERSAARVLEGRNGIFTFAQYRLLKACLHPDGRDSVSPERLSEAFRLLNEADILLMNNKECCVSSLPSMEELLKRRKKAS